MLWGTETEERGNPKGDQSIIRLVKKELPLPEEFRTLFWDIDTQKFAPLKHPRYTIERIFEYGDEKAAQWVLQNFHRKQIEETLEKSRNLSEKTRNFWKLYWKEKEQGK